MSRLTLAVVAAAVLLGGCRAGDTGRPPAPPTPAPAPSAPTLTLDLPLGAAGSGLDGH